MLSACKRLLFSPLRSYNTPLCRSRHARSCKFALMLKSTSKRLRANVGWMPRSRCFEVRSGAERRGEKRRGEERRGEERIGLRRGEAGTVLTHLGLQVNTASRTQMHYVTRVLAERMRKVPRLNQQLERSEERCEGDGFLPNISLMGMTAPMRDHPGGRCH
jgi:hypothetical protein